MYFDFDDRYGDINLSVGDQPARRRGCVGHRSRRARRRAAASRRSISSNTCRAPGSQPPPQQQPSRREERAAVRLRRSRESICRRCAQPDRAELSDVDRSARAPEKPPALDEPVAVRARQFRRADGSRHRKSDARARAPRPSPRPRRRPSRRRRSLDQRQADMAMMQKPQSPAAAGRVARRGAEEPAEVRGEGIVRQPEGPGPELRPAAVRHQGRRVRAVDPPLRLAGAPQLVRADGGDVACAAASCSRSTCIATAR